MPERDEMVLNENGMTDVKIYAPDDKVETAQKAFDAITKILNGENLFAVRERGYYTRKLSLPLS